MSPKNQLTSYLGSMWFIAVISFFGSEILLKTTPPPFLFADKLGEFLSKVSIAFVTAYPFWWVFYRLQAKLKREEKAKIQRGFLKKTAEDYNDLIQGLKNGLELKLGQTPNHILESDFVAIDGWIKQCLKAHPNHTERALELMRTMISNLRMTLHGRCESLTPYQGEFSEAFNKQLRDFLGEYDRAILRASMYGDWFSGWVHALEFYSKEWVELENVYRSEMGGRHVEPVEDNLLARGVHNNDYWFS